MTAKPRTHDAMLPASHLGAASIAAIQQYLRLAESRGLDSAELCTRAGLPATLGQEASGQIPGIDFQRLLQHLIRALNDPILGLHGGDFVQPGSYSVLGYITMSCATLGEAIQRIAPYEKLVGDMGVTSVQAHGDEVQLSWQCAYTDPQVRHHLVDNVFASWINYARWLAGREDAAPLEVELERPSPGAAHEGAYRERWHCPVHFDRDGNRIRIARTLLQTPLRQPDPILRQTLEEHAHARMAAIGPDQSLATRVRNALYQQLRAGITRQDMVADQLAMTARTLQRRLSDEGLSYQILLDQVRHDMARDYLLRTRLPIQDIALHLGFSDVRSFHRRFRTWTGTTPGDFRQASGADRDTASGNATKP